LLWLVLEEAGIEVAPSGYVRIPYRRPDGSVFRWRCFTPAGNPWWGPGERLLPFGLETLRADPSRRALLLCEGESDALACREAYAGILPGSPVEGYEAVGIPGASCWRPEWRLLVERYDLVYLLGDGDPSGQAFNRRVGRDLPWARSVALPPGSDARALLQEEGPGALDAYLDEADATAWLLYALKRSRSYEEFAALCRGSEEAA
jgi:DNA primase